LRGARRVALADLGETSGTYESPGVFVEFGGACPVQGDGEIDGHKCYYRSRGNGWQFEIYDGDFFGDTEPRVDVWDYWERPYIFPDGGWVHPDVSCSCIARAVDKWRQTR
jgi:hypothetical protein